jgi:hypothetical protein
MAGNNGKKVKKCRILRRGTMHAAGQYRLSEQAVLAGCKGACELKLTEVLRLDRGDI